MLSDAHIKATMAVMGLSREEAIDHLAQFEATSEDKILADFLRDLFDHHKFDYDRFERSFWRDNEVLARSSDPQWSPRQRECIERMQERYLERMVGRVV